MPDVTASPRPAPAKVLVYHIGSLGDTLMVLPAMWVLRDCWSHAYRAFLTKGTPLRHVVVADAIRAGMGMFDNALAYPGQRHGGATLAQRLSQAALLVRLRARRFDALVYVAPSERSAAQVRQDKQVFRLAGISRRIGFDGFGAPPSRDRRPLATLPGETETLLQRLRAAGLPTPAHSRRDCALGAAEFAAVREWLRTQSSRDGVRAWIALAPGSNMPSKVWPLDRYVEVTRRLVQDFDVLPVIFGGPEDCAAAQALQQALPGAHIAAGALSRRAAAGAKRGCVLYLGNDTGTIHLAASEDVPCVVPFSVRDFPGEWCPMGPDHIVIRRRPGCEGCMLDIGVREVLDAARGRAAMPA